MKLVSKVFIGKFARRDHYVWLKRHKKDIKVLYKYCNYNLSNHGDVEIMFRLKPNRDLKDVI